MAVRELTWLEPDPPNDCRDFFANEYPAMVDVEANRGMIENSGYTIIGDFTLPESAWLESYY